MTSEPRPLPLVEFRSQLENRATEFAKALPAHIKPDHFQRAAVTAAQINPDLLGVERRSLFTALMRCAQDGLIPDGRQAALVIFRDRERGPIAQYFPMVAGIRKLVQQSGEITRFEQQIVYEGDEFFFQLGDDAHIRHVPRLVGKRGSPILAYSIAQFRDGSISREVMTVEEIEKVRAVSRSSHAGPWRDWWTEMARKTVARRHAKSLPMSNDVDAVLARDDETAVALPPAPLPAPVIRRRASVSEAFDRLASAEPPAEPEKPKRRGRPRKSDAVPAPDSMQDFPPPDDVWLDQTPPPEDQSQDDQPVDDEIDPNDPDVIHGMQDARAGHTACLDPDIRKNETRFAKWRAGFYRA